MREGFHLDAVDFDFIFAFKIKNKKRSNDLSFHPLQSVTAILSPSDIRIKNLIRNQFTHVAKKLTLSSRNLAGEIRFVFSPTMTTETRFVVYGLRNRIIQKADINPVSAVHVNTLPLHKQDVIWSYSKSVHFSPFLLSSSMLILVSSHCRSVHRLQHTEHGAGVA